MRPRGKCIHLETFGCQMNELDSELVRSQLSALGYRFTSDASEADIILYNTCSVREQAENKVLSRVGLVGRVKKDAAARDEGRRLILGVIGCMAEREGPAMIRRFPQIDLMCGPGELDKLPMLLENVLANEVNELADRVALQGSNSRRSSTLSAAEDNLEMLDLSRAFDPAGAPAGGRTAYVRITRGCNKFCTYCVVPHTRGPEVHRPPDAIVDECKRLADAGVIEVTLLGQTVNHYLYTHGAAVTISGKEAPQVGPGLSAFNGIEPGKGNRAASARVTTFANLLGRIHDEVPQIQRLRFVTSFPLHFGDDVLHVMRHSPRICRYLHVPAQSGSNRILKLMNRGYSREEYLEFIHRVRAFLPDAEVAGDIIVGFPTETEEDFERTKELLLDVKFKNNFIFKYSPRPGTVAIKRFEDDVPEHVKRRRNNELLALQSEISSEVHSKYIGRIVEVFVEQVSEKHSRSRQATRSSAAATILTISASSAPSRANEFAASENGGELLEARIAEGRSEEAPAGVQVSGRTSGDLITVFDRPSKAAAAALIGQIVPVRIVDSGPLLLRGVAMMGEGSLS